MARSSKITKTRPKTDFCATIGQGRGKTKRRNYSCPEISKTNWQFIKGINLQLTVLDGPHSTVRRTLTTTTTFGIFIRSVQTRVTQTWGNIPYSKCLQRKSLGFIPNIRTLYENCFHIRVTRFTNRSPDWSVRGSLFILDKTGLTDNVTFSSLQKSRDYYRFCLS